MTYHDKVISYSVINGCVIYLNSKKSSLIFSDLSCRYDTMTRSPNRRRLSRDQRNHQLITRQISQRSRRLTPFCASLPTARQSLIPQYSYRLDLGPCNVSCRFCGASHWIQERSYRSTIESPLFFNCCQRGQIVLPPFPDAPEPLKSLLQAHTEGIYIHPFISISIQLIISCKGISFQYTKL